MWLHCSSLGRSAGTGWVDDIIPGMLLMYSFLLEEGRAARLLKEHFIEEPEYEDFCSFLTHFAAQALLHLA